VLARDEIPEAEFIEWLPAPLCVGNQRPGMAYELVCVLNCPGEASDCSAEVFESLGRFDDAILVASTFRGRAPFNPVLQIYSTMTVGRCLAAKGGVAAARAPLDFAVLEAHRARSCFSEVFAVRELWLIEVRVWL